MTTGLWLGLNLSKNSSRFIVLALIFLIGFVGAIDASAKSRRVRSQSKQLTTSLDRSTTSPIFSSDRLKLQGKVGLMSQMIEEDTRSGSNVNLNLGVKFQYKFVEQFQLRAELRYNFSQERYQAPIDDHRFSDGASLNEAVAVFKPHSIFELGAGAVNQGSFVSTPLLISNRSFPGLYEQLQFGSEANFIKLRLNQAIPTSRSFDSDRQEKEETPSYTSETLSLGWTPNKHIHLSPFAKHYRFLNLPSQVAFISEQAGNTVDGTGQSNSEFRYDFNGFAYGINTELRPISQFFLGGGFQHIQNSEAPEAFNTAQMAEIYLKYRHPVVEMKPYYTAFFNESDVSPARYNSSQFGNSNRQGYVAGLEVTFPRHGFKVEAQFVDANIIDEINSQQKDRDYLVVWVETLYVEF